MKCTYLQYLARRIGFVGLVLAVFGVAWADQTSKLLLPKPQPLERNPGQFTFVRVAYDSEGGYNESYYDYDGRRWQRWETDYPEAEQNFLFRIRQLTTIDADPNPITLRLTDPALERYPFIYMCDVGWQILSQAEAEALRKYLLNGGFLWVDDFWGDGEWMAFERNMRQVFPDRKWRKIPDDHPILKIVYPLETCPQIPARVFYEDYGIEYDIPNIHRPPSGGFEGVIEVHFRGWFDDNDRLMVVTTHNSDVGDGWEREAEDREYFERFSVKAYAIGINIVVYALTH